VQIYRIKEEELPTSTEKRALEDHGYLWFRVTNHRVGGTEQMPLRIYRSIGTGHNHMWFDTEVECSTEENDDE